MRVVSVATVRTTISSFERHRFLGESVDSVLETCSNLLHDRIHLSSAVAFRQNFNCLLNFHYRFEVAVH